MLHIKPYKRDFFIFVVVGRAENYNNNNNIVLKSCWLLGAQWEKKKNEGQIQTAKGKCKQKKKNK